MSETSQNPEPQVRQATDSSGQPADPSGGFQFLFRAVRPVAMLFPRSPQPASEADMGEPSSLELLVTRLPADMLLWLRRSGFLPSLPFRGNLEESIRSAEEPFAVRLNELSRAIRWAGHLFEDQDRSEPIARQLESLVPPINEEAE